jgi:hypothetical protein
MKNAKTISKINAILDTTDYHGIPRGTIVTLSTSDDADDIAYLIRHKIICWAGDRLVMAY